MRTNNKTHHTHVGLRKSRACTASRTLHAPPSPHTYIKILRLGLDRVNNRGSVALIFVPFRGSFEGNTAIFLEAERAAELSEV